MTEPLLCVVTTISGRFHGIRWSPVPPGYVVPREEPKRPEGEARIVRAWLACPNPRSYVPLNPDLF